MSEATEKTLRPYQSRAVADSLAALEAHASALVVLPTGTGKTVCMARLASGWDRGNVLLLAHRTELVDQAADRIAEELGYRPEVEQALRHSDPACMWSGGKVIVGSVQTLASERIRKFDRHPFGLVMIDEAHHATAASYRRVVDHLRAVNPGVKVLGVTATPNRADEKALGIVFDAVAHEMGMLAAIEEGWLVPVAQEYVSVDCVDFSGLTLSTNGMGESDIKAADLDAILVEEEPLQALAVPIFERCGEAGAARRKQGLVFASGVTHAHMLAGVLNRLRADSAKAIDGKTDRKERSDSVAAFRAGDLQFLVNFGVFTEGFDAPCVGVVAMGRPTKSESLYTQMAGRGTRPLPGVVDGPPTAEARRAAIAASDKPSVLLMDFVGNSRHKLVSSVDILGGNYDVETRALAAKRIAAKKSGDVADELRKAKAELALVREQQRRAGVKARVGYTASPVDPFGRDLAPEGHAPAATRGGCSDAQIGFLVNLGVPRDTAAGYGKAQAGAVITSLKAKRCTDKQRSILAKYGEPTDVPFERASELIDAIARNQWKPLRKEAASA